KIGEIVRIPTNRPALSAAELEAQAAERERVAVQAAARQREAEEAAAAAVPHVQLAEGEYTDYIVSRGETLYTVSRRFNVPVESIKLANGLADNHIREGQRLQVPKKALAPLPAETVQPVITTSS